MIKKLVAVAFVVAVLAFFDIIFAWGNMVVTAYTDDQAHPLFPPFEVTDKHVADVGENFTYIDDQGRTMRLPASGERFFSACLVKSFDPVSGQTLLLPPSGKRPVPFAWIEHVREPFGECSYRDAR